MEQRSFPEQAIAARRLTALLSHQTYTTERRAVYDAILRLSFDLGRNEAPVPSQAWLARVTGLDKGDVSRAERSLVEFGMLKRRRGADNYRLYEALIDSANWGGKDFRWRIADPAIRRAALEAEMILATTEGPGSPEQGNLGLAVEPSPREEFLESLGDVHRQAARAAAGALPGGDPNQQQQTGAAPTVGSASSDPSAERFLAELAARKARRAQAREGGSVGQAANAPVTERAAALATQPTPPRVAGSNSSTSAPVEGCGVGYPANALATRPTPSVGYPANALATRPTPSVGYPANASRPRAEITSHFISSPKQAQLTSHISSVQTKDGKRDVASVAEGNEMGDGEMNEAIIERIGEAQWREWDRWWRKVLRPAGRKRLAREALAETKVQLDLVAAGRREPIVSPGAFFVDEFCALAREGKYKLHPRQGRGQA